jgi:hypothetical protein
LKANQNMMQLSEELTSTENKVSFARQGYNDSVMVYNTQRESFPTNILAGMFNFAPAELFVIDQAEQRERNSQRQRSEQPRTQQPRVERPQEDRSNRAQRGAETRQQKRQDDSRSQ